MDVPGVDQDIKTSVFGHNLTDSLLHLSRLSDINGEGQGFSPGFVHGFRRLG